MTDAATAIPRPDGDSMPGTGSTSRLGGHLDREVRDDVARAIRELLRTPFLVADTNETVFSIVRKRRELAAVPGEGRPPGRVSDVPWDGELADAMRERNIVVPEELVVAQLLEDMAGTARQR